MPRARGDRTLTRNAAFAGIGFAAVAFVSAFAALSGGGRDIGPAPKYVASHHALKVALVDVKPEPAVKRDPRVPVETPGPAVKLAAAPPAPANTSVHHKSAPPPAEPVRTASAVPLPAARPAPAPAPPMSSPRERANDAEITGSIGKSGRAADKTKGFELASAYAPDDKLAIPNALVFDAMPAARNVSPPQKKPAEPLQGSAPKSGFALASVQSKPAPPPKPQRPLTAYEKLYGTVRLASLSPTEITRGSVRDSGSGLPRAPYDKQTAVYVISQRKVYMPDGSELEAHSGLGSRMDDPRFVRERMRGATPPHVYDLSLREKRFHGVEAIRLNPIGGEDAIFGRDGLLAHTYMLGGNGQSNGCVSFRHYDAFLKAFKAGKIDRLAVLATLD